MTSIAKRASKALFAALDVFARPLAGPRLLIYHQIGGGSGLEMEVAPDSFRRHVDWLARHFEICSLDDALRAPSEAVVLTFDDGYRSVYEEAFPLLRERGLPFTVYLTTAPIETGRPLRDHPGAEPLSWDMVQEMMESGLASIGSHTHTHPDLRLLDPPLVEKELSSCDELIRLRVGVQPDHFAYPWGYWSSSADRVVRAHYVTAALGSQLPSRRLQDDHLISRIPVQLSDGVGWFGPRVRGGLLYEEALRRRLRGYRGP